jgi:hypothetical protein
MQSNFLVSAYNQWFFRSPDRIKEVNNVLTKLNINPVLFTGVERQIIASIENDFYSARQLSGYSILNWNNSYRNIEKLIYEFDVKIKAGILPDKKADTPLIQDFCKKADLTLHFGMKNESLKTSNSSFDQDFVEGINNAIDLGFEMMGPHESNDVIALLSSLITSKTEHTNGFLSDLKSYVDSFFWESNQAFCRKYNLDSQKFKPLNRLNKQEILDIILNEDKVRSSGKSTVIENYRVMSARITELCIRLAKNN